MLATFPVHGRREVDAAVAAAREAASWWAGLGWSGRRIRLLAWKSHLIRYMGRLAQLMHEETGKPLDDAKLEIITAVLHIDWAARHARRVLRPRRVRSGLAAINQASTLEYLPLGVVGVIGPWNYPVFTPVGSIAYALAAGNAVVFKPSELTPATGEWLVRSFGEALGVFGVGAAGAPADHRGRVDRRGADAQRREQDRLHRVRGHRAQGDGRRGRQPDPGAGRVRRQGRAAGRGGRRPGRGGRRRGLGRDVQRGADLRRASSGCTWPTRCTTASWSG